MAEAEVPGQTTLIVLTVLVDLLKLLRHRKKKWCLFLDHMRTHFDRNVREDHGAEGIPAPFPTAGIPGRSV